MAITWEDVGIAVGKYAPLLASALAGNPGPALLSLVSTALGTQATPDAIAAAVQSDPQAATKLAEIESNTKIQLQQIIASREIAAINAEAMQIQSVNKTLQTEAMGGGWLQRNHHALESLSTVALVWGVYVVLPLAKLPVPSVPTEAFIMLGAILGVTAWQRGAANVAVAKQ